MGRLRAGERGELLGLNLELHRLVLAAEHVKLQVGLGVHVPLGGGRVQLVAPGEGRAHHVGGGGDGHGLAVLHLVLERGHSLGVDARERLELGLRVSAFGERHGDVRRLELLAALLHVLLRHGGGVEVNLQHVGVGLERAAARVHNLAAHAVRLRLLHDGEERVTRLLLGVGGEVHRRRRQGAAREHGVGVHLGAVLGVHVVDRLDERVRGHRRHELPVVLDVRLRGRRLHVVGLVVARHGAVGHDAVLVPGVILAVAVGLNLLLGRRRLQDRGRVRVVLEHVELLLGVLGLGVRVERLRGRGAGRVGEALRRAGSHAGGHAGRALHGALLRNHGGPRGGAGDAGGEDRRLHDQARHREESSTNAAAKGWRGYRTIDRWIR